MQMGGVAMKFSRTVSYALQATVQLAQYGSATPVPCSRLSSEGNMPDRFLLQILRTLVSQGILVSTRGIDGGYNLARPAEAISVLEVIEAVQGPLASGLLGVEWLPAPARSMLEELFGEVTNTTRDRLAAMTLAELAGLGRAGHAVPAG